MPGNDASDSLVREWTHRNIECRLHRVDAPTEVRWIGYARFGDKWIEVVDRSGIDEDAAADRVESAVDRKLNSLDDGVGRQPTGLTDLDDLDTGHDPIDIDDPNPGRPWNDPSDGDGPLDDTRYSNTSGECGD